jgi:putative ABC transport system ATP-binding protein
MVCIKLEKINKSYEKKKIFIDFDLSVEQGEYVAIVGKSGSGKSTLLNIIGMLEEADSGTITILGNNNPDFSSRKGRELLQTHIGYLFQNYGLIENETVLYNLQIASRFKRFDRKTEKRVFKSALEKVGLSNIEKMKIFQLSGGEQQRVAIAKLIIKSPDIILADEPTGSLDEENKRIVMSLIDELNSSGKTILLVTHDEEVKKCAKRVVSL